MIYNFHHHFVLSIIVALFVCAQPFHAHAQTTLCDNGIRLDVWYGQERNSEVRKVQAFLRDKGYYGYVPTGNFYDKTKMAVLTYQFIRGLYPTGTVGEITRRAMNAELCPQVVSSGGTEASAKEKFISSQDPVNMAKKVDLAVPLIEQIYPLSCEAASLQMALAYKGVHLSQDLLINAMGKALPLKKKKSGSTFVWGDPDIGFVGDIKGYVWNSLSGDITEATGWGVNNGPVARVASQYRNGSIAKDNATTEDIENALDNGNPVIFWHVRDEFASASMTYKTSDGKDVSLFPDHVSLVTGYYRGALTTTYVITDPKYGKFEIDQATLMRWWGKYHNDMVIVS